MRCSFESVEWNGKLIHFPSAWFWRQRICLTNLTWKVFHHMPMIQFELMEVWYVSRWWKNWATFWRHSELELPTHLREASWTRKEFVCMAFDKALRSFSTALHVRVLCMSFWMDQKLWRRTLRLQSFIWKSEDNTFLDKNVGVWNISAFFKHSNMFKQTNHVLMQSFLELTCIFASFCQRWHKDVNMRHSSAFCVKEVTCQQKETKQQVQRHLPFTCVV